MAVKKYFKFDTEKGYLEDKNDINYFATNQIRKVAFGKMLGDFDENGLYVINQKIVDELIKMPKVIVEMVEGADLIRSKVKADSFFHFILTVEDNKASFKLLEKIHYQSNRNFDSGIYSNINEYVIDEVIVPDKDFDRNALYEKYNISVENDGEVLSIFDMDELSLALYYNIVEKLKINYLVQNSLILKEKELESLEADYFESVLAVIVEFAEFSKSVTDGVKKDLAEKHNFVIVNKPFFQHTVNEILDSYIEQYIQGLTEEQREQIVPKLRAVKAEYYEKFKTLLPIEIAQKAGVRFNKSQIDEQNLIDGAIKEIITKGYTSSDVRKIVINDDELQLSILKIREMVKENEDICKRDNAKAKDITTNRPLTTKFYNELEKENKVDILKPDTTLIKSAIDEKSAEQKKEGTKTAEKVAGATATKGGATKGANTKGKTAGGGGKTTGGTKTAGAKPAVKAKAAAPKKQDAKSSGTTQQVKVDEGSSIIYGTGTGAIQREQAGNNNLLDELMEDDRGVARESSKTGTAEAYVQAAEELTR